MLRNILLLDFQVAKICSACAFYMHMVMGCIGALGVGRKAQMN